MESILSHVRGGDVLNTYDFVDVIHRENNIGWQVKSTKESTPVTWKRAKLPNATELIAASKKSATGRQALGNAIIEFCNAHARESISKYKLTHIGYSRLMVHKSGDATYFERLLCTSKSPDIFDPAEFRWQWSAQKKTKGKTQLQSLHGINRKTKARWWAWHGLGENQLHFTNESIWWPSENDQNKFTFKLPSNKEKVSFGKLADALSS